MSGSLQVLRYRLQLFQLHRFHLGRLLHLFHQTLTRLAFRFKRQPAGGTQVFVAQQLFGLLQFESLLSPGGEAIA